MSTTNKFTPSFWKMFPDTPNAEEKALKFMQLYFDCGKSMNKVAKELGYDPHTVARIMDDVQTLPIHTQFIQKVNANVKGFSDVKYQNTLFARYEEELSETERDIAEIKRKWEKHNSGKEELSINQQTSLASSYMRLKSHKLSIMNKMLETSMSFIKKDMPKIPDTGKDDSDEDIINQAANKAYTSKQVLQ